MFLSELFPFGIPEIIVLYLPLSDLLLREKEDPDVSLILSQKSFWKKRFREEFNLYPEKDYPVDKLRMGYYRWHLKQAIKDGFLFELGQLCLPFKKKDLVPIIDNSAYLHEYVTGAFVAGKDEQILLSPLEEYILEEEIEPLAGLHSENEDIVREVIGRSIIRKRLFTLCSERVIDNVIKFKLENFDWILNRLIQRARRKDVILVEYLLSRYKNEISQEDVYYAIGNIDYLLSHGPYKKDRKCLEEIREKLIPLLPG